jgi:hypothetical protein
MPKERKGGRGGHDAGSSKKSDGRTVCALCARIIRSGGNPKAPVIYSICTSCKRLPYKNPGSISSLN